MRASARVSDSLSHGYYPAPGRTFILVSHHVLRTDMPRTQYNNPNARVSALCGASRPWCRFGGTSDTALPRISLPDGDAPGTQRACIPPNATRCAGIRWARLLRSARAERLAAGGPPVGNHGRPPFSHIRWRRSALCQGFHHHAHRRCAWALLG